MVELMPGAEPFSAPGGPHGVLVCHGFTGNPQSMRPLAEAFAAAGFAVELPRWPGHGTTVEEMLDTTWDDWSGAAEAAYTELAGRCDKVVVAGLSMGGTLCAWLAARHPEVAGMVVVNPAVEPPADSFIQAVGSLVDAGHDVIEGIGSDIAKPGAAESAYKDTPIRPMLAMFAAINELAPRLGDISCPVLIMTSRQDHVVPPTASDYLAERVSGPVERVWFDRSYHVATLDYDQDEVETRAVEFARKVTT
jgi:carboxylesterase